jgi:hypothetical protein
MFIIVLGAGVEKSGTWTNIFVSRRMWMNIFWPLAVDSSTIPAVV